MPEQPSPSDSDRTAAFPLGWAVAVVAVLLAVAAFGVVVVLPASRHVGDRPAAALAAPGPSTRPSPTGPSSTPVGTPSPATPTPATPTTSAPATTRAPSSSLPPSIVGTRTVEVADPVAALPGADATTVKGRLVAVPGSGQRRNCLGVQTAAGLVLATPAGGADHLEYVYDRGQLVPGESGIFTGDFAAGTSRAVATINDSVTLIGAITTTVGDLAGSCGVAEDLFFTAAS